MSDLDRNRYDRHRKFLREGLKRPGMKCECDTMPKVADHFLPSLANTTITINADVK